VSTASKQSWGCDLGDRVPPDSERRVWGLEVCGSVSKTKKNLPPSFLFSLF
jgi:hypothetical protein